MPPPVPRPLPGQRCRWSRSSRRRGPGRPPRCPGSVPPVRRTALPALHSAGSQPRLPCGTFPRRSRAHPREHGQKIPAERRQCGRCPRSAPRRWARPSAPDCSGAPRRGRQRTRCSPAVPARPALPPAGCSCRRGPRRYPAPASRAGPPAGARHWKQKAPASRTRPHGGRGAARA